MIKARTYIIQLIGIMVLLCGYLISDQPDNLSLMHFDPSAPSVIHKTSRDMNGGVAAQTASSTQSTGRHKSNVPKHFPTELMMPHRSGYVFLPLQDISYVAPLPERYSYLFYEEINPPPPKAC